jgi:hypothetical protein
LIGLKRLSLSGHFAAYENLNEASSRLARIGCPRHTCTFTRRCGDPDARHGGVSEADARDLDQALRLTAKTFVYTRRGTTMDVILSMIGGFPYSFASTWMEGL